MKLEQKCERGEGVRPVFSEGRAFQVEGMASLKAGSREDTLRCRKNSKEACVAAAEWGAGSSGGQRV